MERTDRTFEVVEFPSEGARLRGRLYRSRDPRPAAAVVMAHGTSATITMVTDRYAEVFQDAGLAVLLYDHRNFGDSGGEPRQEINPWVQAGEQSLIRSMNSLQAQLEVHLEKLALYEQGGGYTSSVEAEIQTFRSQIAAIEYLLGN